MKAFIASYNERGSWGYYEEHEAVIFAENKESALGWAMSYYPKKSANYWEITEVDPTAEGFHYISGRSS